MSETRLGQQILQGLADAAKFYEQVSLLVRTAEEQLVEAGWTSYTNSMKAADISSHLYQPHKWMPRDIARFYLNEDMKGILVYIGVLLNPEHSWQGFTEPWLTCGLLQFAPDIDPTENLRLSLVEAHLEDEYEANGEFQRYQWAAEDIGSPDSEGETYRSTMALPLVELASADDLKNRVITPLLEEVERAKSQAADGH